MIKLGITGGIGSGKSVVCEIFRVLAIPVFDADAEAKRLNDTSPVIREKLTAHFGNDLYSADNRLNRKKLAEIIFGSDENLQTANSIIHPEVAKEYLAWTQLHAQKPFTVLESAILFDAGFQQYTDKAIAVYAPEEIRMQRALARDNVLPEQIRARMSSQMPEEEKMRLADFVIYNDNVQPLLLQTARILRQM